MGEITWVIQASNKQNIKWPCHNVITGFVFDPASPLRPREDDNRPPLHYSYVIMSAMASQITSHTIVYWTVYSGADQRKHQSSVSKRAGNAEFWFISVVSLENLLKENPVPDDVHATSLWYNVPPYHSAFRCDSIDFMRIIIDHGCSGFMKWHTIYTYILFNNCKRKLLSVYSQSVTFINI